MPLVSAGQRITAGLLAANYAASDIGAVTVTQAALTDLTATFTVPAGDAVVGNIYEIEAWGNGVWGSTQQQLNFQNTFAGTADGGGLTTIAANQLPISTAFRFRVLCRVICLTTGVSGTFSTMQHGELTSTSGTTIATVTNSNQATIAWAACDSSGTITADTTSAQGLKIQAFWGSTTGAPTITKRIAIQRKLGIG